MQNGGLLRSASLAGACPAILLVIALCSPAPAQEDPRQAPPSIEAGPELPLDARGVGGAFESRPPGGRPPAAGTWRVRRERDGASIVSKGYRADLGADGLSFWMGEASERPADMRFTLEAVRIGETVLFDAELVAPAAPAIVDDGIVLTRGSGLLERYEPREGGVEQLFTIDGPPAEAGDLVVEGRLTSPIEATLEPGRGIVFGTGKDKRSFGYGLATLIDADGRTVPAPLSLEGERLSIRVPGADLVGLRPPLIVDPLIGSNLRITQGSSSNTERECAVAWNSVDNEYLVVYERLVGSEYDIYGQLVSPTGILLGFPFAIRNQAGVAERNPDVAYSPQTNRYCLAVVYGSGSSRDAIQVSLDSDGGYLGAWYVDARRPPVGDSQDPKVVYQSSDTFCFAWSDSDNSVPKNQWILTGRRNSSGSVVGSSAEIIVSSTTGSTPLRRPSLCHNTTDNRFYYAWEQVDTSVEGRALSGDIAFYIGPIDVFPTSSRQPAVAYNPVRNEYLALFANSSLLAGGDYDLFMHRVLGGTSTGTLAGGIRIIDDFSNDQGNAAVRFQPGPDEYLVAYDEQFSATDRDIYALSLWSHAARRGNYITINNASHDSLLPALATSQTSLQFIVAWEDNRNLATASWDIWAQRLTDDSPRVFEFDPPHNSTGVARDYAAKVYFSDPMKASTINTTTCRIIDTVTSSQVTSTVTYNATFRVVTIKPSSALVANRTYRIEITTGAQDTSSNPLPALAQATFTTGSSLLLVDTDLDGLLDLEEQQIGTSVTSADTDSDGAGDLAEFSWTDPLRTDTDNDGTSDAAEILAGTNPLDPNSGGVSGYDVTPPTVVAFSPRDGATSVELATNVFVHFSEPINPSTVVYGTSFKVENITPEPDVLLSGAITYQNGNRVLKFDPSSSLPSSSSIRVTVPGGTGMIGDPAGNRIATTRTATFATVASAGAPTLPANEALHHPSYGESTAAGQMQRHFGDGNVPDDPAPSCVYPDTAVPGSECGSCEICTIGIREPDIDCTGVPVFLKERSVVSLANGVFIHGRIDWAYPDRSIHTVIFGRTYRSNLGGSSPTAGMFGYRWASNWETALLNFEETGLPFNLRTPDGRVYPIAWSGSNWVLPTGFYGRFFLDGANAELKLIFRNGLMYAYSIPSGKLKYIRDRNGKKQTASYTGSQLTSVTDGTGRTTTLAYNGSGRVTSITTYDTLVLSFGYDANQDLISVTLPPTDEFPSGRQEQYTYTGNHLLATLVNGRGQTYLTNRYDGAGLIESQDHINGTHFYLYDFSTPGATRTTLIDRMGNATDVVHDANGSPATVTQYSRGANPLDPTSQWVTAYAHNANGEVSKVVLPRGNVWQYAYGANGHVIERRRKTADIADNDANDLVEKWKIAPDFGSVLRYMEPRATDPGIAADQKVAYTRFYFYDHEDIPARLLAETSEMGSAVAIAGNAEKSWGRTGTGQFPAKDGAVFGDNDGDGLPDRGGNLWITVDPSPKVVNPANPSQFQASRQVVEHFYSYTQCGQLLLHRDPVGDMTRFQYYSGTFNLSTYPSAGFLLYSITDSGLTSANLNLATGDPSGASEPNGHLALTTTFTYDARGNTFETRSPRGFGRSDDIFKTTTVHDANNLLRTRTVSAPFSYQTTYSYDGNQMLVEERAPNVLANDTNNNGIQDGSGEQVTGTPAYFRMIWTYCACNDVLTSTVDADGLNLTTSYGYDLNQQRTLVRDPYGNVTVSIFDERGLLASHTRGANDTSVSSQRRYVYDANGNQIKAHDADLDVDPTDTPTVYTFDLFDRLTKVTDELANESETFYDRGSFARHRVERGPESGGAGTPEILAESFHEFDELGRQFQVDRAHFDAVANVALADGSLSPPISNTPLRLPANLNSQIWVFDADSHVTVVIDDNLHATAFVYDRADRRVQATDARGNITVARFNADGNVIDVQEQEVADLGSNQTFVTRTFVDELGRTRVRVSPLGNTTRYLYDSRSNVLQTADAQADSVGTASGLDAYSEHLFDASWPDVSVSGRGNRVLHAYDGAGRLTTTTINLSSDGSGNGAVVDTIVLGRTYDAASRLIGQTDDNGNLTRYTFDALNRRTAVTNADNTQKLFFYDRAGNLRHMRDERNVVTRYTVDKLGRVTETIVQNLPPGPGQTTYELLEYDGLSRLTRGENNHSIFVRRYDSLGPVIREDQTVNVGADRLLKTDPFTSTVQKIVAAGYDGVGNRAQLVYSGGTVVNESYDPIDRRKLVKDGMTTIAEYMYIGAGTRVLERRLPQGSVTLYRSYDGDRRVTRHDQRRTTDSMRLAGYTYAWDRVGNRWYERTLTNNTNPSETAGAGEAFEYDSAYRMIRYFQGVTSGSLDSVPSNAPRIGFVPSYSTVRTYDLDGVGSRLQTHTNSVVDTIYAQTGDDFKTNQYSLLNDTFQTYDASGNLLHQGTVGFFYDSRNQLTRIAGVYDSSHRYDVLGRRVSKRMASGNFPGWSYGHSVWIHFGPDLLEEYDASGSFRKEWLYGMWIDEPLRQRAPDYADLDNDSNVAEIVALYYLTNSIGTVAALADAAGVVKERYAQDVWGSVQDVLDKTGASTGAAWTKVGNPWVFTGRQFEFEEQFSAYYQRARHYRPFTGQYFQRDPLGSWGDPYSLGGSRVYAGSNPANYSDASGLKATGPHQGPNVKEKDWQCFLLAWDLFKQVSLTLKLDALHGTPYYNNTVNIYKEVESMTDTTVNYHGVRSDDPRFQAATKGHVGDLAGAATPRPFDGLADEERDDKQSHWKKRATEWDVYIKVYDCCHIKDVQIMARDLVHESIHVLSARTKRWDFLYNKEPHEHNKHWGGANAQSPSFAALESAAETAVERLAKEGKVKEKIDDINTPKRK